MTVTVKRRVMNTHSPQLYTVEKVWREITSHRTGSKVTVIKHKTPEVIVTTLLLCLPIIHLIWEGGMRERPKHKDSI